LPVQKHSSRKEKRKRMDSKYGVKRGKLCILLGGGRGDLKKAVAKFLGGEGVLPGRKKTIEGKRAPRSFRWGSKSWRFEMGRQADDRGKKGE